MTAESIIPQQRADSFLTSIIIELEQDFSDKSPNPQGYFLYNKTLHKIKDLQKPPTPENSTLVIPEALLPNLIGEFHLQFGHLGVERLTSLLTSLYTSKFLPKYTKALVLGCIQCQQCKVATNRLPPISPSPQPVFPMQILSLDYFLVPPHKGYKFILLAIDRFSGYIFIRKCKQEGSTEVIALLKEIFTTVGPALTLTSDNGSTLLKNRQVKNFLALWGVTTLTLSLPYSPLHNAKAERAIRGFRSLMRLYADKTENWTPLIDKLTYMYNSTPRLFTLDNKKLLISPYLLFLRRPPAPCSLTLA